MGHYFTQPDDYDDSLRKESPTLHQNCRIDRGMNKKGKYNRSWRSQGKGRMYLGPILTYTYICTVLMYIFSFL
jgi:hypothetical protein